MLLLWNLMCRHVKKASYLDSLSQLNPAQMTASVDIPHLFFTHISLWIMTALSVNVRDAAFLHQGQIICVTNLSFLFFAASFHVLHTRCCSEPSHDGITIQQLYLWGLGNTITNVFVSHKQCLYWNTWVLLLSKKHQVYIHYTVRFSSHLEENIAYPIQR